MVIVHFKKSDDDQFLLEGTVKISINDLAQSMATISNTRILLTALCSAAVALAEHGPTRNPEEVMTEQLEDVSLSEGKKGLDELPRVEEAPAEAVADKIKRAASEAQAVLSPNQVAAKVCVTMDALKEAKDRIKGAVMIAYPQGLPAWDPARVLLETDVVSKDDIAGMKELYDPDTAVLWWANKELSRDKLLSDYIGRNEKTKVLVKMTKKGAGPPVREPPIDAETQRAMMMYWHKKQEQEKRLAQDTDDQFLAAEWADPRAMKRHFTGMQDLKIGPK